MENIFEHSSDYLKWIRKSVHIPVELVSRFTGKSAASVSLTKFGGVNGSSFFAKQGQVIPQEQYEFSKEGLERCISFINQANLGSLLITGGGEPFTKFDFVKELVKRSQTDQFILVTCGYWATSYDKTKEMLFALYDCFTKRKSSTNLILRLNVDKWHYQQLGKLPIENILEVFKNHFSSDSHFKLVLHTFVGDSTIQDFIESEDKYYLAKSSKLHTFGKDSFMTGNLLFEFSDYAVTIEFSEKSYSNLRQNLNSTSLVKKAVKSFRKDIKCCAFHNPSIVSNLDGQNGFHFWIHFNGNVSLFLDQQLYDLSNIYVDTYQDFLTSLTHNIVTYSFLDKGYFYRTKIMEEVNPKAVLRSEAMNMRSYSGASILEENHSTLYYAIRVMQDYLKQKVLKDEDLLELPIALLHRIYSSKRRLIQEYQHSSYSIITQYQEKKQFVEEEWKDLFTLIYLGHYEVSLGQIFSGIDYYNAHATRKIRDLEDALENSRVHYERLQEKLTFMKPEARNWCIQHANQFIS